MHPMKKASTDGINAKLRRMTEHYGSASGPANNRLAPTNRMKAEGPESAAEFGAESGIPRPRADRASRISNPIPTLATGGAIARASGGRAKKKGGATNVNVIVAPQGGGAPPPTPPPMLAGPPPGASPMPPRPPMGPGPMGMPPGAAGLPMAPGAPGGLPPGIVPPRASGGRIKKRDDGGAVEKKQDPPGRQIFPTGSIGNKLFDTADKQKFPPEGTGSTLPYSRFKQGAQCACGGGVHDDEAQDKALIERTLKNEGLVRERAAGGRMPHHHMTAGAVTGEGRLQKIGKKPKDAGPPQAV